MSEIHMVRQMYKVKTLINLKEVRQLVYQEGIALKYLNIHEPGYYEINGVSFHCEGDDTVVIDGPVYEVLDVQRNESGKIVHYDIIEVVGIST